MLGRRLNPTIHRYEDVELIVIHSEYLECRFQLILVALGCFGSYKFDYTGSELARINQAIQCHFLQLKLAQKKPGAPH
jgi:hypothetical protein